MNIVLEQVLNRLEGCVEAEKSWVIYGLNTSTDSAYRYVGYSSIAMRKTFIDRHINRADKMHRSPLYAWMRSVGAENVRFEILEECPKGNLEFIWEREVYWITHFQNLQGNTEDKKTSSYLKNLAVGGRGNTGSTWTLSEESRRNQSRAKMGSIRSEESKRKQAETITGRTLSTDHVKAISEGNKRSWDINPTRRIQTSQSSLRLWHSKGSHIFPHDQCPECPAFIMRDVLDEIKEACIAKLKVTPAGFGPLRRSIGQPTMHMFTLAFNELVDSGVICESDADRFRRWKLTETA